MNTAPIFSAVTAISFETAGSMVEESINSVPFFTFLIELRHFSLDFSFLPSSFALSTSVGGGKGLPKGQSKGKAGLLEDAIWSGVNLQDIRSGRKHGDDAIGSLRHLTWRVHYLITSGPLSK